MLALFSTPNENYFFDVNRNEVVPISDASYAYLQQALGGKGTDLPAPAQVNMLKEQGYFSTESYIKEVRHIYSDYLSVFLARKLTKITVQLTQNCNFRCKYCIYSETHNTRQRSHSTERMTWETAKKAIDFLREHSVDSPEVNIGFYGGEPLLEFPLLKKAVEYSEQQFEGKKLTFNITTNGTLLNDEMIYFFQEHDVSLMISLDGPKEINDKNRVFANGKGTFDTVAKQISRIREIAPQYGAKLQISMVMDPSNDFDCINEICLNDSEFRTLSLQPAIVERDAGEDEVVFSEEYTWKFEYQKFLSILSYYNRFPQDEVSPIARRSMLSAVKDYEQIESGAALRRIDAPSGPCIPGQLRVFVHVHGQLFPCERVSERSPAMCIGTLDDGFNLENAQKILNVGKLTEESCKNCWCFRYCTLCAKKADDGSGQLSAEEKLSHCKEARAGAYNQFCENLLMKEIPIYYAEQVRCRDEKGGFGI